MFSYTVHALTAVFTALAWFISAGISAAQPNTVLSPAMPEQAADADAPIAVRVLQSDPEASYALQQAGELYAKETGADVVFHIQTISGRNDYRAALRSGLLSGEEIDLFHLLDSADVQRLSHTLADLSSLNWAAEAYPGRLHMLNDEHIYGIPYALEGVGLIINRAIFSAAGISPDSITDGNTLRAAIVDLQAAIDNDELDDTFPDLTAVTDLAVMDSNYLSTRVAELLLTDAFTDPIFAGSSPSLEFPFAEQTGELLQLLAAASPQRGNWAGFTQVTGKTLVEKGLAAERIAMALESTSVYFRIWQTDPDMAEKFSLLPVYFGEDETGHLYTGSPAWWGINTQSEEKVQQYAANFLEWLYTSENGVRLLEEQFHVLSPYPVSPEPEDTLYRQLRAAMDTEAVSPQLIYEAPDGWYDQTVAPQLREYFTVTEKTWQEVLDTCKTDWRQRRSDQS